MRLSPLPPIAAALVALVALTPVAPGRALAGESARVAVRDVRAVDGRPVSLVPGPGGATAVVFYSTECPISNAYSPTLNALAASHPGQPFAMVGICVDSDLSAADVARHAAEFGLKYPVALDRDGSIAARFGARVTPEAFVIDAGGTLRYSGRVDDQFAARGKRNANPKAAELREAVDAVLAGRDVAVARVDAVGCPVPVAPAHAAPTFAREVAPILQNNCQECHRPGQVGPFPLMTYEQARKRADDIADQSGERRMPPWKPTPGVGPAFAHSKALTADEIATLAAWAKAGAPEGNPAEVPRAPTFSTDWALGRPDLVVEASEAYPIPAEGGDIYRCFVIPTDLPEDMYISAVEYRPDNRRVVHHILGYVDVSGNARKKDAAEPGPGYMCFGGPGVETHGDLGGWAPGAEPAFLPEGVGRSLPKKADVVMQVHYHPSGKPEVDRSKLGIYFARKPTRQTLHWNAAANLGMKIPAGDPKVEIKGEWEVPVDVTALAVSPHMHLLGRDIAMSVTFPDGNSLDLIRIDDWNFDWQNQYFFERPIDLPKGTKLRVVGHFDNSAANPKNPKNPPIDVKWGEATTDEMCIGFLAVVKKGQDLTRPGEKDDLNEIFQKQREERRKRYEEMKRKQAAEKGS